MSIPNPSLESWEELFSRDPLSLSAEDVEVITRRLVEMARAEIEVWNSEKRTAATTGTRMSGLATAKKQRTAIEQLAASRLGELKF